MTNSGGPLVERVDTGENQLRALAAEFLKSNIAVVLIVADLWCLSGHDGASPILGLGKFYNCPKCP